MLTFNIPAWSLLAHATVPLSIHLIDCWYREMNPSLSSKKLIMEVVRGIALGTLLSCPIAYAAPAFHHTFSIAPFFLRETIVTTAYLAAASFGLFLYYQLKERLEQ